MHARSPAVSATFVVDSIRLGVSGVFIHPRHVPEWPNETGSATLGSSSVITVCKHVLIDWTDD